MEGTTFRPTKIVKRPILSHPGVKLLSGLLLCFEHIQSKIKDAKAAVRIFFKSKRMVDGRLLQRRMASLASKGLNVILLLFVFSVLLLNYY